MGAQTAHRFTLTPQRMRIVVEAFKESLELGLAKNGQVVVRTTVLSRVLISDVCFC